MKQIVLIIVFATSFVACASGDNPITPPDLSQIRIKENPGETLKYVGRIGSDFDTALDSLRKLKSIPSDITKEPLEVLFDYDDRLFFGIVYGDCGMYSDVLDTKGFYYLRSWYSSDEDNVDWQEEHIFKENRTFTDDYGCMTITYQSRIGYDFESALDSLIKRYEPILNVLETEGHYSGEGLNIEKEKIHINFNYDNRDFIHLTIIDKANKYRILFSGDVIDGKGNHYYYSLCDEGAEGIYSHLRFIKKDVIDNSNVIDNRYSFDISGRKLNISPSKGLYIQGGKKTFCK